MLLTEQRGVGRLDGVVGGRVAREAIAVGVGEHPVEPPVPARESFLTVNPLAAPVDVPVSTSRKAVAPVCIDRCGHTDAVVGVDRVGEPPRAWPAVDRPSGR